MSQILSTQRPGVFSSYTISQGYTKSYSNRAVGVVARTNAQAGGEVLAFTRASQVEAVYGPGMMFTLCSILFSNHVAKVYCASAGEAEESGDAAGYEEALRQLESQADIGGVVCDNESPEILELLKEHVLRCSNRGRERLAFGGGGERPGEMAERLNCERFCLAAPQTGYGETAEPSSVYLAAAYAALAVASEHPAENLNYGEAGGSFIFNGGLGAVAEEEIDYLIQSGVGVFEPEAGGIRLIRAVTTAQNNPGYRELTTIRIADDIIVSVRGMLQQRLKGARNSEATRESIRSQTALELSQKKDAEIIGDFDLPVVYPKEDEPTICIVEIGFSVIYAVHQIHLTAYIQV